MGTLMLSAVVNKLQNQQPPPLVEAPPVMVVVQQSHSTTTTHRSIETLVVVVAVITIVGVMAGIIARLCGGRHLGGNGDQDIEGCVEMKCRNCIDAGVTETTKPAAGTKK